MELAVYSSVLDSRLPNLVSLQSEALGMLPTLLVCPLKAGLRLTALRVEVDWLDEKLVACPELARPIRRTALLHLGRLDKNISAEIMDRMQNLLAD